MKKILFAAIAALTLLSVTSCGKDDGFQFTLNIIIENASSHEFGFDFFSSTKANLKPGEKFVDKTNSASSSVPSESIIRKQVLCYNFLWFDNITIDGVAYNLYPAEFDNVEDILNEEDFFSEDKWTYLQNEGYFVTYILTDEIVDRMLAQGKPVSK